MKKRNRKRSGQAGVTLIEMLVVVTMIVVEMAMIVRVIVVMIVVTVTMIIVLVVVVLVVVRRRHRRTHGMQWPADAAGRIDEAASLDPQQSHADEDDERIACELDDALGVAHHLLGRIQEQTSCADKHYGCDRLQQGGGKRQNHAAPPGFLIGNDIG